jgi:hypothetical protein
LTPWANSPEVSVAKAGVAKIAKYGDRFKATAVKLSSLPGVQIKDVRSAMP